MDERIRDLMDAVRAEAAVRRVSVKALAAAADVSYVAMRRYLAGGRSMSLSQMYRVVDVLGTSLERLMEDAARRAAERARGSLRETITQSEGTDAGPQSQAELDERRERDIQATLEAGRVKRGRRSA